MNIKTIETSVYLLPTKKLGTEKEITNFIKDAGNSLYNIREAIKTLKKYESDISNYILDEENDILGSGDSQIINDKKTIKITEPTAVFTFDEERYMKEHPKEYESYCETTIKPARTVKEIVITKFNNEELFKDNPNEHKEYLDVSYKSNKSIKFVNNKI